MKHVLYILAIALLCAACTGAASGKADGGEQKTAAEPFGKVTFCTDSAMEYLLMQTAAGPRVPGSPAHEATARNLIGKLASFTPDTIITQNTSMALPGTTRQVPMTNILARWGTDKNARLLLLAHWDTRPYADEDPNPDNHQTPIDGANDGASGVAVLLEIARNLNLQAPPIGIDILFVDLEDSGSSGDDRSWCLGTQHFAQNLPYSPGALPRYAILLDMVGGKNALFHREYFSDRFAADVVDHIWNTAAKSGYSSRFVNQPGNPINDDHIPLNQAGIPAIDIIENKNPQTGTFNPTWHTLDDTYQNIDPQTITAVGQTIANLIYNEK